MVSRRNVVGGVVAGVAVLAAGGYYKFKPQPPEVGFSLSDAEMDRAMAFLKANPAIDSHAHPGRTFVREGANLNWKLNIYRLMGTFENTAIADMNKGGMAGAVFNGVADFPLLELGDNGLTATREFEEGESWAAYRTQIENLIDLEGARIVTIARNSEEILAAHALGRQAAVLGMEGADFLENDIDRLQTVYEDGVRMITLIHYHNNTLGDITTGEDLNRGLTDFGHEVVAGMNAAGIVIDASHASAKTAAQIVTASDQPVVITHSHINTPAFEHPRFISAELANSIAESGGYIGAWPAGIGINTLAGFIDRIEELINLVGEDHVALGSDMDANYQPVLETYRKMPLVVGALFQRGHSEEVVAKFIGGNFMRVMDQVQGV
jgi:membrane dipeptidase